MRFENIFCYLGETEVVSTVELDFKNQITNYQLVIYVVNYSQDKNILDFKNQNGSDRKSS